MTHGSQNEQEKRFMKTSIVSLIAFLMTATSNAAVDAEANIVYSEKTIDFYEHSTDKQHAGSLIEVWTPTKDRINIMLGSFNPETFDSVEFSEVKKASLKNLVIGLLEKTPTAMNFSKDVVEEGARNWVSEVTDGGDTTLINHDASDKFISEILMSKEALTEWQQASQMPAKYTFRLGVLTETVKNQVNGVLGEGFDMNHRCSTGTYHKIFFELVAAETLTGKKFNHIESSKNRFFLSMPAKDRRNLFLGASVSIDAPVNATKQELQALCNDLL